MTFTLYVALEFKLSITCGSSIICIQSLILLNYIKNIIQSIKAIITLYLNINILFWKDGALYCVLPYLLYSMYMHNMHYCYHKIY